MVGGGSNVLLCYFWLIEQMGNPELVGGQSQICKYVRLLNLLSSSMLGQCP